MTAVKICGVNSPAAFDAVAEAQADYLGFVFFARSPRHVTAAQAAALSARQAGGPQRVGLFVAPAIAEIATVLAALPLDVLQIYADPAECREIRTRFGLPVWRAAGVFGSTDLPSDSGGLDGFVIEAKAPAGATRPGGNATVMDWSLLRGWQAPGFWLLGGGLTVDNVAAAIAAAQPPAVDVSSGVEIAPGQKSPELIRRFVATARSAARSAG